MGTPAVHLTRIGQHLAKFILYRRDSAVGPPAVHLTRIRRHLAKFILYRRESPVGTPAVQLTRIGQHLAKFKGTSNTSGKALKRRANNFLTKFLISLMRFAKSSPGKKHLLGLFPHWNSRNLVCTFVIYSCLFSAALVALQFGRSLKILKMCW